MEPSPAPKFQPPLIATFILLVIIGAIGGFLLGKYLTQSKAPPLPQTTPLPSETLVKEGTPTVYTEQSRSADWKTYTNSKYNYSINYPQDWFIREFPDTKTGAGFRLPNTPDEVKYEILSINVSRKPTDWINLPFEECAKKLALDVEKAQDLASFEETTTKYGVIGYKTTHTYLSSDEDTTRVSSPTTFFELKNSKEYFIYIYLHDIQYQDAYNLILSTFKFLD